MSAFYSLLQNAGGLSSCLSFYYERAERKFKDYSEWKKPLDENEHESALLFCGVRPRSMLPDRRSARCAGFRNAPAGGYGYALRHRESPTTLNRGHAFRGACGGS